MDARLLQRVGVLGAGQMGSGIAQVFATAGIGVRLYDAYPHVVASAIARIGKGVQKLHEKGRLAEAPAEVMARIEPAQTLGDLADRELIVEAVVENEEIKVGLFRELHSLLAPTAILASNTSSISITRMGVASGRPEQFVGMHFMNPAPLMALVEVVVGLRTSPEVVVFIEQLCKRLGKTHVRAEDYPGFIVNRILLPMINEAIYALQDRIGSAADIDTAMTKGTNQPMGPLALADLIGLDTVLAIMQVMQRTFGDDKYRPSPLLRQYVDAGFLGRKSGRGFYTYSE